MRLGVVVFILIVINLTSSSPYQPYGGSGGGGKGLRGSQHYLQDPWMHEHNYYQNTHNIGPHTHHGWGQSSHGGHGSSQNMGEKATYVQKLYPVFQFSNGLKKVSNTLKALKPGKHWHSWDSAAVALFGSDGTPHHVSLQGHKQPWDGDGWSHNHASHHIGHKLPKHTNYATW